MFFILCHQVNWICAQFYDVELLGLLRSPKAFIAQFFFLLVLSLAIWIIWPRVPGAVTVKSQISIKFFPTRRQQSDDIGGADRPDILRSGHYHGKRIGMPGNAVGHTGATNDDLTR